ncbi:MAG: hypothetical protein ACRC92_11415 [Peptostreptococcaceae bacterium]
MKSLKINNHIVYGLFESLVASGYPMLADVPTELRGATDDDVVRCIKLGQVPTGTGHDNFLKGIDVHFDVVYPVYWSPQFQRYNFQDIISSQSAMHRITKMDLNECTNDYVFPDLIDKLKQWVDIYNDMVSSKTPVVRVYSTVKESLDIVTWASPIEIKPEGLSIYDDEAISSELNSLIGDESVSFVEYNKYDIFMRIISNAPQGLTKTMRVKASYLQLKTMYQQRANHKLKDDWGVFCKWIETLPLFKELCLKPKVENQA